MNKKILIGMLLFLLFIQFLGFQTRAASTTVAEDVPFQGSKLFVPNDNVTHPGVILLHGSEGGSAAFTWVKAQFLAANGYAALAYCYFDCGANSAAPKVLANVEVHKVFEALAWLKNSPYVKGKKTAIYGVSRGAELSMIIAEKSNSEVDLTIPNVILAHAPSDITNPAWSWSWVDRRCWLCYDTENCQSWNPSCGINPLQGPEGKPMWDTLPAWQWNNKELPMKKRIEVERFQGTIFLSVGTADTVWPYQQTQRIEQTLKNGKRNAEVHYFAGEDHIFKTTAGNRLNDLVIEFLKSHLQ